LDDDAWEEDDDPLLELVSIVKLDVLALTPAQLAHAVGRRCALGVELVARLADSAYTVGLVSALDLLLPAR
jgi:hypothetical protein